MTAKTLLTDRDFKKDDEFCGAESSSTFDATTNADLPPERYELLAAIQYLATLEDDWNGYNARKPTEMSIKSATGFIERLFFNRHYPHKVAPDGEGGIIFTWRFPTESILLSVEGSMLHLSHEKRGQADQFLDEIPFNLEVVPESILAHIPIKQAQR